jgi:hypothetical protein
VSGAVDALLSGADTVELAELQRRVDLQTRSDRKYLVDMADLAALLCEIGGAVRVLDVAQHRSFAYESVYFDTPCFDSYLAAAHHRPGRFKVRTRRYLDDGGCFIELKRRTRHGQNDKVRRTHDPARPDQITPEAVAFLATFDEVRCVVPLLAPVVRTGYRRSTLMVGDQRVTIDVDLRCDDLDGRSWSIGDRIVVETKSPAGPGSVDRAFWRIGRRPTTFSKFALAMASFRPDLPANRWHRTLGRLAPGQAP